MHLAHDDADACSLAKPFIDKVSEPIIEIKGALGKLWIVINFPVTAKNIVLALIFNKANDIVKRKS